MSATLLLDSYESMVLRKSLAVRGRVLSIDPRAFQEGFDRSPFIIGHAISDHPLFELPRLIELARRTHEDHIEYNAGDISISQDPAATLRTGLSVEETIRRIEECNSWMIIRYVENDPACRGLMDHCLDEIARQSERLAAGMFSREACIFISSPNAITPYHLDPEQNFLLQIRGTKSVTVFDREDRRIVSEEELERYLSGSHRNLIYRAEYADRGEMFQLNPGDGLHIPFTAPHHVRNGDEVSVSFSIKFRSRAIERREIVCSVNSFLRSRGFKPTPFGRSRARDGAKYQAYRALRRLDRLRAVMRAPGDIS